MKKPIYSVTDSFQEIIGSGHKGFLVPVNHLIYIAMVPNLSSNVLQEQPIKIHNIEFHVHISNMNVRAADF